MTKTGIQLLIVISTWFFASLSGFSQSNMKISNPVAEQILKGNYDPNDYLPSIVIDHPDSIVDGIIDRISTDSLFSYLKKLESFHNRNTGSDTFSTQTGIGACRNWIYRKFSDYSSLSENRLVVSFLDFDQTICGKNHHRNVFAVLPGLNPELKDFLLIEGHYDTRCEGGCDTNCFTPGADDNGSGTVLVLELARVMSRFAFDRTIIFTTVTGEDQGLWGGKAWASYLKDKNLPLMACLNNDVVGGVYCGYTSSPPSCPFHGHCDSTHLRIFSYSQVNDSTRNSSSKQLARYIKLNQIEKINPKLDVPVEINIMIMEDRTGRSGDHIPFRQNGWPAIRFCSANEHGDGKGILPDRTHTSTDIIGVDTTKPADGIIDSFFVNLNYLKRNAITNGVNLGLLANSPSQPEVTFEALWNGVRITLSNKDTVYKNHRVGIRTKGSGTLYFDEVKTVNGKNSFFIPLQLYKTSYVSVANVSNSIPSLFSDEFTVELTSSAEEIQIYQGWLEQNEPNPFKEKTKIKINLANPAHCQSASLIIRDLDGKVIHNEKLELVEKQEFIFKHIPQREGIYTCSLSLDGRIVQTIKMMKTN